MSELGSGTLVNCTSFVSFGKKMSKIRLVPRAAWMLDGGVRCSLFLVTHKTAMVHNVLTPEFPELQWFEFVS